MHRRLKRIILHVLLVSACLAIRVAALPSTSIGPEPTGPADVPSWLGRVSWVGDLTLFGPDAGDWAIAAREVKQGGFPDIHRLPFYARLTAMVAEDAEDIVFAGFLVNILLSTTVVVMTYALGVSLFSPVVGLGAGILVAVSHELLDAQIKFGVDPSFCAVSLALLILLVATHHRHPAASALAGLAAGLTAMTHYLGIALAHVLATTLVFSPGNAWRRINRFAIFSLAAGFMVFLMLLPPYSEVTVTDTLQQYRAGITTHHERPDLDSSGYQSTFVLVLKELPRGLRRAHTSAVTVLTHQTGLGGWAATGLVGLGLGATLTGGRRITLRRRRRRRLRWVEICSVLVVLGLLVGLSAARGAARYQIFAIPILNILLCGGAWAGARLVVGVLTRPIGPWRMVLVKIGATAAALALPLWLAPDQFSNRPGLGPDLGRHAREVGQEIARRFPGDGLVMTHSQEVRYYSGRDACYFTGCPPRAVTRLDCMTHFSAMCGGRGDIPYHEVVGGGGGSRSKANKIVEEWVRERGVLEAEIRSDGSWSRIYRIEVESLPESR